MIKKNDSAYPCYAFGISNSQLSYEDSMYIPGITIRQYYAAKAMQGFLASNCSSPTNYDENDLAMVCFKMADAMIAYENQEESNV